jgi:hypothetical protein
MTYPNLMELIKKHPRSAMWSFNGMYGFKKDGKYHWYGLNKSNQWTFRKKPTPKHLQ